MITTEDFKNLKGYIFSIAKKNFCHSLRSKLDLEDLVQETFLDLIKSKHTNINKIYARKVLLNNIYHFVDHYKYGKRNIGKEEVYDVEKLIRKEQDDFSEEIALINKEIDSLNEVDREIVKLRGEMSFVDLGNKFGYTPNAVRMKYSRAISKIKEKLLTAL